MNWEELYFQIAPNIDFWANYISTRTALEKEDCSQQLLLLIWDRYCKKERDVSKPFAQYCLKYASARIFHNYFVNNETMLNALSIEAVEETEVLHKDVEFYLCSDYIRKGFVDVIEEEYKELVKKTYYLNVLGLVLEGKNVTEIAFETDNTKNQVKYAINNKIKPVIAKKFN